MEHNLVEWMVASMVVQMVLQWDGSWTVQLDDSTVVERDMTWVDSWADSKVLQMDYQKADN